jgi:hypothetical protein
MATGKHYFIEENTDRKFAVRAKDADRASAHFTTQRDAEEHVRKLNPDDKPDVERLRHRDDGILRAMDRKILARLELSCRTAERIGEHACAMREHAYRLEIEAIGIRRKLKEDRVRAQRTRLKISQAKLNLAQQTLETFLR